MQAAKLLAASGTATKLYADDVFSAYTYTGNGSTQTITNGIDLAGKGGVVWTKARSTASYGNALQDTTRGASFVLESQTTAAQTDYSLNSISSFSSSGYSLGTTADTNANTVTFVSWTFRNADKFYNHTTVVKTGGSNATVSFSNLTTLGMVRVKRTDSAGSWYIWHRSLTAGKLLIGQTTAAEATLGHITVSGTTVTLVNGVIADGTYLVEGFAHDTGTDGLIQCGLSSTNGQVTLGWEPQFLLFKTTGMAQDWNIVDTSRGFSLTNDQFLSPSTSAAEAPWNGDYWNPNATGFNRTFNSGQPYIYLAIRRPNKPPTTGTQVYNAIARTGTGAAATVTGVGFAPDLVHIQCRSNAGNGSHFRDRLRGAPATIYSQATDAETSDSASVSALGVDGMSVGADGVQGWTNWNTFTYINHFFKRAPGVFDVACFTGDGTSNQSLSHSLGSPPEFAIMKRRNSTNSWGVYHAQRGRHEFGYLNTTDAFAAETNVWTATAPTSTTINVNGMTFGIGSGATGVLYLFATLAGISKCGSYTGNGSSQTIACGFTTGARFILIKRTDSTGDWYVWDTVRGIVAGNDPHLSLNTTAAEVTTDDSIDPDTSGFIVNQLAATNINVTSATYIFLALA